MEKIKIITNRLELKSPINVVTASEVYNAINHPQTLEHMCSVPENYTLENAKSFLNFLKSVEDDATMLELGIFNKINNTFMGMITLENIDLKSSTCELGYWISKENEGKGLVYEAAREIIEYAKEKLKVNSIYAYVVKEHAKSVKLLKLLGFEEIELLYENEENKGKLVDRYLFEMKI